MDESGAMQRVKMTLAYDGSGFHGFASQSGVRTVADEITQALCRPLGRKVDLFCAGRTDAGVHAWGQVVHFDTEQAVLARISAERLIQSLRTQLLPEIAVRSVEFVDDTFHARFSAKKRTYRYDVHNADVLPPNLRHSRWWVEHPLDIDRMNRAIGFLEGEHDFSTFCRRPKTDQGASLVRRIESAGWKQIETDCGLLLRCEITGNAFCHQMIRSLVGFLVQVGCGKKTIDDLKAALIAKDRSKGVGLAPPEGLCLWEVAY